MTAKGFVDLTNCKVEIFQVENVECKSNLCCFIGGDNGLTYKYKAQDNDDVPSLFSTIKVWYIKPSKQKDAIRRRTIRKWELYTDPSIMAIDESGEAEFEDEGNE